MSDKKNTKQDLNRMAQNVPDDETYVVVNRFVVDAPLNFVWGNFPKNANIRNIMTPYRGFPGAKSWTTSKNFNEKGSSITYKMSNGLTIHENIMKREDYHYVYAYAMPFRFFIFDFWQGNLYYKAEGNKTEITWKYWLKPKENILGKFFARLIIRFVWRGYTKKGSQNIQKEVIRLYQQEQGA